MFVCKGCLFYFREAPASSSEGEEKKPDNGASASENMPEMSADSKLFFHTVILTIMYVAYLTIWLRARVVYEQIVNEAQPSWLSLVQNEGE